MQKNHKQKLAKLSRNLARSEQKLSKMKMESSLDQTIQDLHLNVTIREKVKGNMSSQPNSSTTTGSNPAGSGMSVAKARMRSIMKRRKLSDIIKAQKDDLEPFREELRKLRLRSFPTFATTSKAVHNPDYHE